jgi:ElaB/YqjD/DUF883 family membrane-anchored ribosome-binding protein
MARTRESLKQKLDVLEDRTLGAVQKTTDAVVGVAETVEETVESAKEAVTETVKKTERMFDLGRQVDRHPWPMMGAAVATGFVANWLLSRGSQPPTPSSWPSATSRTTPAMEVPRSGGPTPSTPRQQPQPTSSWLSSMLEMVRPQVEELKQLAIGASVAVLRDLAVQAAPPVISKEVGEIFDSLTERLGGKPQEEQSAAPQAQQSVEREGRPRWEQNPAEALETTKAEPKKKTHGNGRHSEPESRAR